MGSDFLEGRFDGLHLAYTTFSFAVLAYQSRELAVVITALVAKGRVRPD
jgi:hypothetical protein